MEKIELAPDSGGPGKYRGGLGADFAFHMLEESWLTCVVERTKTPPWGIEGGLPGRPNGVVVTYADGSVKRLGKATRVRVPKGAAFELRCGGGGGYGPPGERSVEAVLADVREGYVSEAQARRDYPHAFASKAASRKTR
jgi:N-methylhydantoinase B